MGSNELKRRQEAHIHHLRCGQKSSDHMELVFSDQILIWSPFPVLLNVSIFCYITHKSVAFYFEYRLIIISGYYSSPSHPVVIQRLWFAHGYLSTCQLFTFHLQLSSSAADILTPVYFEMGFKRYQLPFWSQLPLRASANRLDEVKLILHLIVQCEQNSASFWNML